MERKKFIAVLGLGTVGVGSLARVLAESHAKKIVVEPTAMKLGKPLVHKGRVVRLDGLPSAFNYGHEDDAVSYLRYPQTDEEKIKALGQ